MLVTDEATNATMCRELGDSCRVVLPSSGGGCAVCEGGYFRQNKTCEPCHANCTSCTTDATNCLACKDDFYMSAFYQGCIRMADATHCREMTPTGCTASADGSFLSDGECFPCPDR